ncbi:Methylsterol monooxygenase 1 [Balamuthia mandrillaris]
MWASLVNMFPPFVVLSIGTFLWHEVCWLAMNLPYTVLQYVEVPFFEHYKIQKGKRLDRKATLHAIKSVLWSHFFVLLPATLVTPVVAFLAFSLLYSDTTELTWENLLRFGSPEHPFSVVVVEAELPPWQTLLWHVLFCQFVEDLLFYWFHRLLHTKWLYKRIHKVHHTHTAPISWSAEVIHPAEFLIANIFPTMLGALLLRAHLFSLWCWIALAIYYSTEVHSGYIFPWSLERIPLIGFIYAGPRYHDRHHELFLGNYGSSLTWLDYVFGTCTATLIPQATTAKSVGLSLSSSLSPGHRKEE